MWEIDSSVDYDQFSQLLYSHSYIYKLKKEETWNWSLFPFKLCSVYLVKSQNGGKLHGFAELLIIFSSILLCPRENFTVVMTSMAG